MSLNDNIVRANGLYVLHSAGSVESHKECEMEPSHTCLAGIQRVCKLTIQTGAIAPAPLTTIKHPLDSINQFIVVFETHIS
jgi:hypothetical protein